MLPWSPLALVFLSLTKVSAEQVVTSAGIASRLAAACSDGIQRAVEQETRDAAKRGLWTSGQRHQTPQISEGLGEVLPRLPLPPEVCPSGWSRHEDSCYFIPPRTTSWYLAHHECAVIDRRARLASLHPGAAHFLETMVAEFNASKAVWIGLARLDTSSDWFWSDGSPMDYINWDNGQPSGGLERCVHMGWPNWHNFRTHDNMCSVIANLLCQIDLK